MKIFEPFRIGKLELRNRLALAPMITNYAHRGDGTVSERSLNWYSQVAESGIGLVTVEASAVHPGGYVNFSPGIHDDWQMEGLTKLAKVIKSHGATAQIQLYSTGQWAHSMFFAHGGSTPVSPSNAPKVRDPKCHALTTEEVRKMVQNFGAAARRAKECGFDMVMIHGAHGLLIAEFLSPIHNIRTDEYGGTTPNQRARFLLEVIKCVRDNVGPDFPVSLRLSVDECLGGKRVDGAGRSMVQWGATIEECRGTTGNTLEDSKVYVKLAEEAGINVVDISAGHVWYSPTWLSQPMFRPRGCLAPLARELRKITRLPIVVVGRINNPGLAESILQQGDADIIALARAILADNDFIKKTKEGKYDEIRSCVACLNCIDKEDEGTGVTCMVNTELDLRADGKRIEPAASKKKVAIIGAGPGGLEAARVAAMKGHYVTLYDKSSKIGGRVNLAVIPPEKGELGEITKYYTRQLGLLPVKLVLNKEVTPQEIVKGNFQAAVIATGGIPLTPDIPGIKSKNVATAEDVLLGKVSVPNKAVVIGGGLVACDTALFLAEKGKSVTIVRRGEKIGKELSPSFTHRIFSRFEQLGVQRIPGVQYKEINTKGLVISLNNEEKLLEADMVVIAVGYVPNESLYNELKGKIPELYLIGDSKEARTIYEATHEGFDAAMRI